MRSMMSKYGLKRLPFTKELPVSELYWPSQHEDARSRIRAALKGKASVVMTGDPGTGKTFVLRAVAEDLQEFPCRIEYLHNSAVNRREFYRQLCLALGLEPKASAASLFRLVSQHIEELSCEQKIRPILFLDEAHMLAPQILSHLPVLLNFQMDSRPFLSIVLVGLPELKETLRRNLQSALNGRLPVRIHLSPLDPTQVAEYLKHHMCAAGVEKDVFTEEAALMIAEAAGGIMRKVNVLALECLYKSSEKKSPLVDGPCVRRAVQACQEALA